MPKRLIDYEAVWSSYKLSLCKRSCRVEYLWIYGLADAGGSFEMTNLRSLWGKVSPIRPDLSFRKFKICLEQYEKHGLLFTWTSETKRFGHWVGSRLPGRLPPVSQRSRFYFVCPEPPTKELQAYNSGPESRQSLDLSQGTRLNQDGEGIGLEGMGKGGGIGFGTGAPRSVSSNTRKVAAAHGTAAQTAAASIPPLSDSENSKPQTIQVGSVILTIRKCECGTVIEPRTIKKSFGRDVCAHCRREVFL